MVSSAAFITALLDGADDHCGLVTAPTATLRLTIKLFVLRALLDKVAAVVPTRDVMPVLKCFQIRAGDGRVTVTASDMELSVIAGTEMVAIDTPGTAVIPAKRLLDMIKEAADPDVSIDVGAGLARIRIGRTNWTLKLPGGHDYPLVMPSLDDVVSHTIDRGAFTAALARVRYAACRDQSRVNLRMIDIRDGRVTASDGARFHQVVCDLPQDLRIPIDAVDDLLTLADKTDVATITVAQTPKDLIFTIGSDVFLAKKLDHAFPDVATQLLRPALENNTALVVDRAATLAAIRRTRILADPNTSAIALELDAGKMVIVARQGHDSHATETLDVDYTGPARVLGVNHSFFTDLLRAATEPTVTLWLGTDLKTRKAPILLREGTDVAVVQQMHIDWSAS